MRLAYLLVFCLFLTACLGGNRGLDFNQYEGQDGIVPEFSTNAPPERVYENTPFPVRVQLHNMGAVEVQYEDLMITFSGDPLYVEIPEDVRQYEPTVFDREDDRILGRSLIYPDGEKKTFNVPPEYAFYAKPIYGTRERPETQLIVSACYKYFTLATTPVCIDTNAYYENEREQPCEQETINFGGGQGAPIAVTKVEVESFPVVDRLLGTDSVRPHFTIHLKDVGTGRLIGPDHLLMDTACFLKGIDKLDLNAVKIRAWLLNTELECQPGELIRLVDGEGIARCTVPQSDLSDPVYASKQNFLSNLIVNLSYLYKSSESLSLDVNRVPGTDRGDSIRLDELSSYGKETGIMYSGDDPVVDDSGNVYTECRYYAENTDKAPPEVKGKINSNFHCGCSREICLKLAPGGNCLFGGYCRPATYCCDKTRETVEGASSTGVPTVGSDPNKQQVNLLLEALQTKYGIPNDYLKAIAYQESKWDNTPSGYADGGKAHGMMQVHEDYHPNYNIARGDEEASYNAEYGANYLKKLHTQYGSWEEAIKRYNGSNAKAEAYRNLVLNHASNKPWSKWL